MPTNLYPRQFTDVVSMFQRATIQTTDATVGVEMLIGGVSRITIPDGKTWVFDVNIVARQVGGAGGALGNSAGYVLRGVLKRIGASTTLVGAQDKTVLAEDDAAWDADAAADDVNEALSLQVTGAANQTIEWEAVVKITEVE